MLGASEVAFVDAGDGWASREDRQVLMEERGADVSLQFGPDHHVCPAGCAGVGASLHQPLDGNIKHFVQAQFDQCRRCGP